jgi:hypothetical protein
VNPLHPSSDILGDLTPVPNRPDIIPPESLGDEKLDRGVSAARSSGGGSTEPLAHASSRRERDIWDMEPEPELWLEPEPEREAPDLRIIIKPVFSESGYMLKDGTICIHEDRPPIGSGTSGRVYTATMTCSAGVEHKVAAKVLHGGATERQIHDFEHEYATAIQLSINCSGVCKVYGCIKHKGQTAIIMKRYPSSFAQWLQERREKVGI